MDVFTTYLNEYLILRKKPFQTAQQGIQLEKKCLTLYKRVKQLHPEEHRKEEYKKLLKNCYLLASEVSWSLYRMLLPNEMHYFSLYQYDYQAEYEKQGVRFFVDLCAKKTNQSFSFQSLTMNQKSKKQITKKEWKDLIKKNEKENAEFPTFSDLLTMDRSII